MTDVTLDGRRYCLNGFGGAVHIGFKNVTGAPANLADGTTRATYTMGGAWDAGSPWYELTANPARLELLTTDTRYDPLAVNAYPIVPLQSVVEIWTAVENPTNPPGGDLPYYYGLRYTGVVLSQVYTPRPGGGADVAFDLTDAVTALADRIVPELNEEPSADRLRRVLAIPGMQVEIAGVFGPTIGRTHPDQHLTHLKHANDCALSSSSALIVNAATNPTDASVVTLAQTIEYVKLGREGYLWALLWNPAAGYTPPSGYQSTRVAGLDHAAVIRDDLGYRTRITVARDIAKFVQYNEYLTSPIGLPVNNFNQVLRTVPVDVGEVWEWSATFPALTLVSNPGGVIFRFSNANLNIGAPNTWEIGRTIVQPTGTKYIGRFEPAYYNAAWSLYREIIVAAGGTVTIPASTSAPYRESLTRQAGTGPFLTVVDTAGETARGVHAVDGLRLPIAQQASLQSWATNALGWLATPRPRVGAVRVVANEAAAAALESATFIAGARAGDAVAVRYTGTGAAQSIGWLLGSTVTLAPDAWTCETRIGPRMGVNP